MPTTMDRISNKLKLVRSQSMGVGMGGQAGEAKVVARPEGRPTQVVLLDERRLELNVQSRLYAGELLDLVASQCGLREKEYFGLAVVDDAGHYTWLQLDRKVLDHDLPRKPLTLTVHFLVKFFKTLPSCVVVVLKSWHKFFIGSQQLVLFAQYFWSQIFDF